MGVIQIFTEGNDCEFISDYIKHLCKNIKGFPIENEDLENHVKILQTKGRDNIHAIKNKFTENTDNEGINLVIFDADFVRNPHGGGIKNRTEYLNKQKLKYNLEFDFFLFPNNIDDGEYENLLEKIINTEHECIFECFDKFQKCISKHEDENGNCKYKVPILKTKIYSYADTLTDEYKKNGSNFNKGNFFFSDSYYWNLDHPSLDPLKGFLMKHIVYFFKI